MREDNRRCLLHAHAQVEYAIEAIKLGSTAVGIQTKEGVVLAVEKRLTSPLLEPSSVEKVVFIECYMPSPVPPQRCRSLQSQILCFVQDSFFFRACPRTQKLCFIFSLHKFGFVHLDVKKDIVFFLFVTR